MKLAELATRGAPAPWQDGGKIPWGAPAFSARMLLEHLDQGHDEVRDPGDGLFVLVARAEERGWT